jgi:hypothetical protein
MDKISQALARIKGQRVYIDTNIFIYFFGQHERYFEYVLLFFQAFNEGVSVTSRTIIGPLPKQMRV